MIRFPTSDRRGDDAGWCKLFDDGQAGVFGDWRSGVSDTWQGNTPKTDGERAAFLARVKQAREEAARVQEQERAECRKRSAEIWGSATEAKPENPYLLAKQVKPYGVRQWQDNVLVPVRDSGGTLHGLQFIGPEGAKKFKKGTAVAGCYHSLGKPDGKIIIAEGYATGATLHEITGHAVAVAFNAGNLKPVAEALRAKYPDIEIIIAADDDHATEGNPGLTKATEAAQAVNGLLAVPAFPDTRGAKDTDFNDLVRITTPNVVKACIDSAAIPIPSPAKENASQTLEARKIKAVSVLEFMQLDFPPRRSLLAPWLPFQGLTMVYAPRGIGKTHFSLGVAYAVSSGGKFLNWEAPAPAGVLFLDGEMPANVLKERIARLAVSEEKEPAAPFHIITPDLQPDCRMLDLSRLEDQQELQPFLEGIALIIVDNLSTLCRTGKENEGEGWLTVQQWALQQRAAGRSVLFIHHAGKNGEQRGTSRREDVLDTVIALKRPADYTPDKGACFEVHFEKARGLFGDDTKPFEAQLTTTPDGQQAWTIKPLDESTAEKVAKLLNEGVEQKDIPEMLGIHKGSVSKAKKRAQELGLLKAVS
ncbi:AAA family ATPase [Geobacter sp. DSM 9736]|uniref:AAA family ATPase n=1 Tax=Geobacter sp. DSM 9736 TaxID=1277350 RepID=UPI0018D3FBA7|nr:AAA family ATPase [Geobacter sp. DSM 9736]